MIFKKTWLYYLIFAFIPYWRLLREFITLLKLNFFKPSVKVFEFSTPFFIFSIKQDVTGHTVGSSGVIT